MELHKIQKRKLKALKENNEIALCAACIDLAECYKSEEKFKDALNEYKTLENIYKKQKKVIEVAKVNRGIGEIHMLLNDYSKAIEHQKIYLNLSKSQGNNLEEQRALATLGHTFLTKYIALEKSDKNDLNLAYKYTMKSLEVCESLVDVPKYELVDMTARLYNNLGIIEEFRGYIDKGKELFKKAIVLCKANDVYESLYQAYVSLASLMDRTSELNSSIQNYNLAIETAKKLKKPTLICECLVSKSAIFLKLGDVHAAKKSLHKAYRMKCSDSFKRDIAKKLKTVVLLHRTEKELVSTSCSELKLQKCYEKIGDGFSTLGCYEKALEFYMKMLESAVKTGSELSPCYYSLAATYRDDEQFDKAVEYFEKEYMLCEFKKGLDTLCEIADTKEMGNYPSCDVIQVYEKAIENCKNERNIREEGRMLNRLIEYLHRSGNSHLVPGYNERFNETGFYPSDSEESPPNKEDSCSSLGSITDEETDDSDLDSPGRKRRVKTVGIRRNLRGETQLHTACINGKLNVVKLLIEQGHPVNIRDNSGWLPLHDACVNGHTEIVEFLLEKGAAINDRGGTHCDGITPLHDAAVNAHLDILELLLDKGASPLAKTDEGETPYHYLRKMSLENSFSDVEKERIDQILERMGGVLDKAGQSREIDTSIKNSAFVTGNSELAEITQTRRRIRSVECVEKRKRSSSESSRSDPETEVPQTEATNQYKAVMVNLRREKSGETSKNTIQKRSAFVLNELLDDDDWLEDDLGKTNKKRRISNNEYTETLLNSSNTRNALKRHNSLEFSRRKSDEQSTLLDAGFVRNITPSDLPNTFPQRISKKKGIQTKITRYNENSPEKITKIKLKTPSPTKKFILDDDPILAMDVNVEGRVFRVTTKMSLKNELTVKWLALETSRRYAKKEYVEPVLELTTKSGAELVDEDQIATLFVTDSQVVEINAKVLKWKLPPILDRYKEACSDMETPPLKSLCDKLETLTVSLDISNFGTKTMAPLCKALLRETRLLDINLTNNYLNNECVKLLSTSLATLENLTKLNLSCTNLHLNELRLLRKGMENSRIQVLNLSENFLNDECLDEISKITKELKEMKELYLSMCNFTERLFVENERLEFNFDKLECFDLSWNNVGMSSLKFCIFLNFERLTWLDFSEINPDGPGFLGNFVEILGERRGNFKYLNLSRCRVDDFEVFSLIRACDKLETLNLSYNNVTGLSLRRLLGDPNVSNLIIMNCDKINEYFDENNESLWVFRCCDSTSVKKTLKITCDRTKFQILIKLWERNYRENSEIIQSNESDLLILK